MRKGFVFFLCLLMLIPAVLFSQQKGSLFIIGGGSHPESMMSRFIELAKDFQSGKIIVFPMASSVPDEAGLEQAEEFRQFGARQVEYHILTREQALKKETAEILKDCGGVFFTGGVQSRLADVLMDTPVLAELKILYDKGAVIGGTSAGAAVMSEFMITGDEKREVEEDSLFETIQANNIITERGFGFIKTAIIDQHFVRRKRHNRLLSLVLEHPQLLGIGIGEATAIIVKSGEIFEVVGERNVIVYDAADADIRIQADQKMSGHNLSMHILQTGDVFDMKKRKVIGQK